MKLTLALNGFGEKYFQEINPDVFQKVSAQVYLEKFYNKAFEIENYLSIVVGSDSLQLIEFLKKRPQIGRSNHVVIVVDLPEVIQALNKPLPKWIKLLPASDLKLELQKNFQEFLLDGALQILSSVAVQDKQPQMLVLKQMVDAVIDTFTIDKVRLEEKKAFLKNIMVNHWALESSIDSLKNTLNQPVLIIASGPSFDHDLEWIAQNQANFLIIAIGRMAKVLQANRIRVDVFVSIDPTSHSYENSREMLLADNQTLLVYSTHCLPALVSGWQGPKVYIGFPFNENLHNYQSSHYDCYGPTVTHTAIQAAFLMGAETLYLSGVDFCFSGGRTHSKDSLEANLGTNIFGQLFQVETYSGEMAETEVRFNESIQLLAEQMQGYHHQNPNFTVYNLNPNAAKIDAIKFKDKSDVCLNLVDKTGFQLNLFQRAAVTHSMLKNHLQKQEKQLTELRTNLVAAKPLLVKLNKKLKTSSTPQALQDLVDLQLKIQKKVSERFWGLVSDYGAKEFNILLALQSEFSLNKSLLEKLNIFSKALEFTMKDMLAQIDLSLFVVKTRQLEMNSSTQLTELYPLWREVSDIARYRVWHANFCNRDLNAEEQKIFTGLDEGFFKNFSTEQSAYKQELLGVAQSIPSLVNRIFKLIDFNRPEEWKGLLSDVTDILAQNSENTYQQLEWFIRAKLYELEGNFEQAKQHYMKVQLDAINEIRLKGLLHCALQMQDFATVMQTFEQLSQVRLTYLVNYAEFLMLHREYPFAKNVLQLYLSNYPEDKYAWLKMHEVVVQVEGEEVAKALMTELTQKFGHLS